MHLQELSVAVDDDEQIFWHSLIQLWCAAVYLANLALHRHHLPHILHWLPFIANGRLTLSSKHSHTRLPDRWLARICQIKRNKGETLLQCGQVFYAEYSITHVNVHNWLCSDGCEQTWAWADCLHLSRHSIWSFTLGVPMHNVLTNENSTVIALAHTQLWQQQLATNHDTHQWLAVCRVAPKHPGDISAACTNGLLGTSCIT